MSSSAEKMPEKPQDLAGRIAIVTGATRGIGRAISLELASRGCSVLGTFVSPSSASYAETLGMEIAALRNNAVFYFLSADLHKPTTPAAIATAFTTHFPKCTVDILINNAASTGLLPVASETLEHLTASFTANLTAPTLILQALLPHLSRTGSGRIVNISSESARIGRAGSTAYTASKAGLEGLTRVWAKELGQEYGGLTVNAVAPGIIQTDLMNNLASEKLERWRVMRKENAVAPRAGTPEEVAEVVAWLCGDGGRWVSGSVVPVNGGSSMF